MATPDGGGGRSARGNASWAFGLLLALIPVEIVLDILGLPLDEFLIPIEGVLDIGLLLVALVSARSSGRYGSGRAVGTGRSMRHGRRGLASVSFLGVAIFWGLVVGIIAFQLWWSAQSPLLSLLFGIFIFGFDALLILLGFLITIAAVIGRFRDSGRQIGGGMG